MTATVIEPGVNLEVEVVVPSPIQVEVQVVGARGVAGPSNTDLIGDIEDLTTEDKSTIVAAINEINMDGVSLSNLYTNAKAG